MASDLTTFSAGDHEFDAECLTNILIEHAQIYELEVSEGLAKQLVNHLHLVLEKNKVVNLTRIVTPEDAIDRHCIDSLLFYKTWSESRPSKTDQGKCLRFLDLGTGAGYPGIPFALISGYSGTLLDSVGKKVRAVNEFIDALGLANQICGQTMRVEELALSMRSSFDLVLARAVAQQGTLIEYASPLLARHGCLITSKANISNEEIHNAEKVARLTGMENVSRETFELPHNLGHREIFIYQKVGDSKVKLPRRVGMAKNKPLWESHKRMS